MGLRVEAGISAMEEIPEIHCGTHDPHQHGDDMKRRS
jgi:hypothetical protein